jgi:peroxiredoxin Q/BCP
MRIVSIIISAILAALPVTAQEASKLIAIGDQAPDVQLPNPNPAPDAPETVQLSSLRGENVLLAFYPKAFTPGCTAQMCGYRDDFAQFQGLDTTIIAISGDKQEASDRFKTEYALPFPVIGDPSAQLMKAFGIPVREMAGVVLAKRAVVLIDKEGYVRYVDPAYDVSDGKKPLLNAIQALQESEQADESSEQPTDNS